MGCWFSRRSRSSEVLLRPREGGRSVSSVSLEALPDTRTTSQERMQELINYWGSMGRNPYVFEVWPEFGGKSRYRCGGYCIIGPAQADTKFNVFAWFVLVVPSLFYFVFCAQALPPAASVSAAVLFSLTLVMMMLTSCTDPGIIPRHSMQDAVPGLFVEVAEAIGCIELVREGKDIRNPDPELMEVLRSRGFEWCHWCNMLQPPRAKHCRDCASCILRNDHHCPFVNNCIGQRNYAFFLGTLCSASLLGLVVFIGAIFYCVHVFEHGVEELIKKSFIYLLTFCLLSIPTLLLAFVAILAIIGLSIFHTYLVIRQRTTRECLTGRIRGEGPTLCAPRGASLLHPHSQARLPAMQHE